MIECTDIYVRIRADCPRPQHRAMYQYGRSEEPRHPQATGWVTQQVRTKRRRRQDVLE
jgi:hypothetical protein